MKPIRFFTNPFLISLLTPFLFAAVFFYFETTRLENETLNYAKNAITNQKKLLTHKLQGVAKDLNYLAENILLRQYLDNPLHEHQKILGEEFAHFSRSKGIYDQIRLIDTDGNEIVRVNYDADTQSAKQVDQSLLQNKKDRYYFKESIGLNPQEIYLSKLDLNVEHGKVEEPYKPMLRFARPVIDTKGETRGILILNYLADDMLTPLRKSIKQQIGDFSLLNDEGYWLIRNRRMRGGLCSNRARVVHSLWKTVRSGWISALMQVKSRRHPLPLFTTRTTPPSALSRHLHGGEQINQAVWQS